MPVFLKTKTQEMLHHLQQSALAWLALLGVIVVMIWMIYLIRTRYRDGEDPMASQHFLLTQMGDLHRQGDLTEEEYRSIKGSLVSDLQKAEEESAKSNKDGSLENPAPSSNSADSSPDASQDQVEHKDL